MLEAIEFRMWVCAGCDTSTLEECYTMNVTDMDTGEIVGEWTEIETTLYPERAELHVQEKRFNLLPALLNGIYRETLRAFNNGLMVLCAIGIRALIEGICADQEIAGRNLEAKIEGLSSILPKNIVVNLHSIRFMGNEAAHELTPPEPNELRLALEICEDLLNFLYELDYKATQLSRTREERRRATKALTEQDDKQE